MHLLRRKRPHAIPEADEGERVRAQNGDDDRQSRAESERVVAGVVVEDEALACGSKGEDSEGRHEQEREPLYEKRREDDPVEANDGPLFKLFVVHWSVVVREEGARQRGEENHGPEAYAPQVDISDRRLGRHCGKELAPGEVRPIEIAQRHKEHGVPMFGLTQSICLSDYLLKNV